MALKTEKPGSLALLLTIVVAIAITATAQEYEDPNAVVVARSAVAGGRKFTPVVAEHRGAPSTGAITDPEDLAFIIPPENLESATATFVQGPSRARYSPTDGSLIAVGMPTVDTDVTASESGGVITARAAVAATAVASKIDNSQCLATGACITSPSGRFKLCVQGDANIVLYDGNTPYWATNTVGRATGPRLCMQGDGNVVAYGNTGRAYWASNTAGRGLAPNTLYIQNDGNLVAYNKDCRAFWATGARSGTAAVAAPCAAVTPPPTTSLAQEILNLVNTQRRNNGKQPLVLSNELTRAAQLHSNEMLSRKQIFHDNPFTGLTFSARVRRDAPNHGGKCAMGENVASGYQTAQAVMTGWMNSPGHRENILRDNYRSMGLARADPGFYWTQLFSSCPSP